MLHCIIGFEALGVDDGKGRADTHCGVSETSCALLPSGSWGDNGIAGACMSVSLSKQIKKYLK